MAWRYASRWVGRVFDYGDKIAVPERSPERQLPSKPDASDRLLEGEILTQRGPLMRINRLGSTLIQFGYRFKILNQIDR